MQSPHDSLFQFTFAHAHHAAGWLRSILPATIAGAVDWDRLMPLRERFPGVRGRPHRPDAGFVAPLVLGDDERDLLMPLEHKRFFAVGIDGQVLRYSIHLQRALQRSSGELPLVLPVVLRHGWRLPRKAAEEPPRAEGELEQLIASLQSRQGVVVDDLDACSEADLAARNLTPLAELTLLCLAVLPHCAAEQVPHALRRWAHLLRAVDATQAPPWAPPLGADAIDMIGWYALAVTEVDSLTLSDAFAEILQREDIPIMSTLDRTFQRGRSQGIAEGKAEGFAEGRRALLLRLLERRFGPLPQSTRSAVREAAATELERWEERLLDAQTLDAVFDGGC